MTGALGLLLLLGAALLWWGRHPCPVSLVEQEPVWTEDYATAQQHLPGCPAHRPPPPTCASGETAQWSYYPAPVDTGGDTAVCIRNKNDPKNAWAAQDTSYDQWCAQQSLPCPYPQCIKSGSSISGSTEDTPKPKPTPTWAPSTPVCPLCHVGGAVTKSYTVTAQPYCIDKKSGFPLEESLCTATKPHPAHTKCPAVDKCIYGPGGKFPDGGIGVYYFIGNCVTTLNLIIPSCVYDPNVKIIFLAFSNKFGDTMSEESFDLGGPFYTAAKKLREEHNFKGIIQFSIGGQTGSNTSTDVSSSSADGPGYGKMLFNFFQQLTPDRIQAIAQQVQQWKYVDGIDFDIEPAESGGSAWVDPVLPSTLHSSSVLVTKVVPLANAIKAVGRPVTTTSDGAYVNEAVKCHVPRWFSNLQGGVAADLITSMYYPPSIGSQGKVYGRTLTDTIKSNTTMVSLYPETLGKSLYTTNQVALGLLGNSFKTSSATNYLNHAGPDFKFISVWGITPSNTQCGWDPTTCS
jgi:hypothetical protein